MIQNVHAIAIVIVWMDICRIHLYECIIEINEIKLDNKLLNTSQLLIEYHHIWLWLPHVLLFNIRHLESRVRTHQSKSALFPECGDRVQWYLYRKIFALSSQRWSRWLSLLEQFRLYLCPSYWWPYSLNIERLHSSRMNLNKLNHWLDRWLHKANNFLYKYYCTRSPHSEKSALSLWWVLTLDSKCRISIWAEISAPFRTFRLTQTWQHMLYCVQCCSYQ